MIRIGVEGTGEKGVPVAFEDDLHHLWEERVNARFLHRGMSAKDLIDPLDPVRDPFDGMRHRILELMDVLQGLVDGGFEFRLREEHFGHVCWHGLGDIVRWTRNDLRESGIDFASLHEAAREYADCWQGSQLKQNLRHITENLPAQRDEPVVASRMSEDDWSLVADINRWVNQKSPNHRSVVIRVPRSCPVFEMGDRFLPVGGFEHFRKWSLRAVRKAGLPESIESVASLLPDEERGFDYRLRRPLALEHIETIEEVPSEEVANLAARNCGKS